MLRPSGMIVITTSLPSTMKDAVWFMQLHKNSTERFCKLFPTVNQYMSMFDNCGFKLVSKLNLLSTALMNV